jgi:hypothetical protein
MNWKRIIGGGLVAGLVMMVGEFGIEPLMGPYMENFFRRLGLAVPGESAMVTLAVLVVVTGIVSVWLYAAILPRYGAGIRTAVIAGTAVWGLSCLLPNIVMYAFGLYDTTLFWFASGWPLVETVVATIAGAKVYRETAALSAVAAAVR